MIGEHVPDGSGLFVIEATMFHSEGFGYGNLDVIDILPVPYGFKNSIGEAKHQNVLHGFFAQIMINAVDLVFMEDVSQRVIERAS